MDTNNWICYKYSLINLNGDPRNNEFFPFSHRLFNLILHVGIRINAECFCDGFMNCNFYICSSIDKHFDIAKK